MSQTDTPDIIYTKVDEAPELASASLLPIVRSFAAAASSSANQHFRHLGLAAGKGP